MKRSECRNNTFGFRLKRKLSEHFTADPTGWSFMKYTCKWFRKKISQRAKHREYKKINLASADPETDQMAVCISGGLGDHIIHARVLRDLAKSVGRVTYIIFAPDPDMVGWIMGEMPEFRAAYPEFLAASDALNYDCLLYLNTFAVFNEEHINYLKIQKLAPRLLKIIGCAIKKRRPWNIFIDNHPVLDGAFARQLTAIGGCRYDFLHSCLGLPPPDVRYTLPLDETVAREIQTEFPTYVTINTGFDALFVIATRLAVKCYPTEHWTELVRLLKSAFPKLGVIQIGGGNSVRIPGCDRNLQNQTTLTESAGILRRSLLHIDIEGGLVHVCSAIGTQCAVLFGPTSRRYFSYPGNLGIHAGECHDCWWATERWMEVCPRGNPRNECMHALTPRMVFEQISPLLREYGAGS